MKLTSLVLLSLLTSPLAYATFPEFDRTMTVDCDAARGARSSIAHAIDHAREGATILVRGACTETLIIDKRITLDGGGTARIAPVNPTDTTITIDARKVTLRGLLLDSPAANQVAVIEGGTATLESNIVSGATNFGLSVSGNSFMVLLGSTVTRNNSGIAVTFGAGLRLGVRNFTDPNPMPNVISNNRGSGLISGVGVLVSDNASASMLGGNTISGNNVGVFVAQAGHAQIAGNQISGNQIGVLSSTNGSVLFAFAAHPNPLFTALNSGTNVQLGVGCRGGSVSGVPDGLAPAMRLAPTINSGVLGGPPTGLATHCLDATVVRPN